MHANQKSERLVRFRDILQNGSCRDTKSSHSETSARCWDELWRICTMSSSTYSVADPPLGAPCSHISSSGYWMAHTMIVMSWLVLATMKHEQQIRTTARACPHGSNLVSMSNPELTFWYSPPQILSFSRTEAWSELSASVHEPSQHDPPRRLLSLCQCISKCLQNSCGKREPAQVQIIGGKESACLLRSEV